MSTSESLEALRRANPRRQARFAEAVDAAAGAVRARIETADTAGRRHRRRPSPGRRLVGVSAVGIALVATAAVAVFLTLGSSSVTPGVENADAVMKRAATLTAASADQSGTATVRMTHNGQLWALKVVRWNGDDLALTDGTPGRPESGLPLLVVNGTMYGHDPAHKGWIEFGPVASIDPGSGTTPTDILAAVREDTGGATLRRITGAMTADGLTTRNLSNGSTVYRGKVAAGQIARETGFKEGQAIRVFPFGYVAHGDAADPTAPLNTAVTVGADGVIREIAVAWGTWTYTVTYTALGATPKIGVPANAKTLRELRHLSRPR